MSEELNFADSHLEEMKASYESGGSVAVIAYIAGFSSLDEREVLYRISREKLMFADKNDLDSLMAVARAGVMDFIAASETSQQSGDKVLSDKYKAIANIASYNLAADLAECWPNDTAQRSLRHFEAGLAAAINCLQWGTDLKKGPWSFSMAWWAKGAHELSLSKFADAVDSFNESKDFAFIAANEQSKDPTTDFGCILAGGYVGMALEITGGNQGRPMFDAACTAFEALVPLGGEVSEDSQFGLDQLNTMRSKIIARIA